MTARTDAIGEVEDGEIVVAVDEIVDAGVIKVAVVGVAVDAVFAVEGVAVVGVAVDAVFAVEGVAVVGVAVDAVFAVDAVSPVDAILVEVPFVVDEVEVIAPLDEITVVLGV